MASRPIRDDVVADPVSVTVPRRTRLDDVLASMRWFRPLPAELRLAPGAAAPDLLRVPERDATAMLARIVHLVADIPAKSAPVVVWTQGRDELRVHLDRTRIACLPGIVQLHVTVGCDELRDDVDVMVPIAVGTAQRPAGLLMTTVDRLAGPAVVTSRWSDAITAFAWEALVTTAQQLAAAVGRDASGRALVPGALAAERGALVISPVARQRLEWRSGT